MKRLLLSSILLLTVMVGACVFSGSQDGFEAYNRRDYATAWKKLKPLAEQGYADAQYTLGTMYERGRGVPEDVAVAVKWYRLAANQGHALSQDILGGMYAIGRDVPQDYAEAVK